MDFGKKKTATVKPKSEGANFLTEAKHSHAALFRSYVELQDKFENVEQYTDALQADAWKLTEQIAKQSWRNGIARGEARQEERKRGQVH